MFEVEDDVAAYEDELYREESSSDESIDSEVEFYLYSQVHYSQNLNESNLEGEVETTGDNEKRDSKNKKLLRNAPKQHTEQSDIITLSDSDDVKAVDTSGVITLSDTGEEDSVYASKIRRKVSGTQKEVKITMCYPGSHSTPNRPKASTPRNKTSSGQKNNVNSTKKSYAGGVIQEVLVIRGSSEEEDSEDQGEDSEMSDSDLENWMLLGTDKEDGDASIQLNLEGCRRSYSEGEKGVDWSISEKDLEAQIGNYVPFRRSSNRYYTTEKNVVCRNCDKRGHLSKNCPTPRKLPACCLCGERGHLQNSCPHRYCSNCFIPGHFSRECIERSYWKKQCHRCAMTGHYADACPEIWRQYHITVKPGPIKISKSDQKEIIYCSNCGRKGHGNFECTEKRMFSGSFPISQLIFCYDRDHDIWKRNQRAKKKIEELQEAGLLPLKIRQPHKRENNMQPFKKIKKRHLKELKQADEKEVYHSNKNKFQYIDGNQKKKHKKKKNNVVKKEDVEEDFPRGGSEKAMKSKRKRHREHPNHLFFDDDSGKPPTKRQKRRNRAKRRSGARVDQSLLTIKQRKKKIKKEH
ncbi:zinc finger CCHC domain-containing protein 7 isoform 1-T2 [Discoglossus pictus]